MNQHILSNRQRIDTLFKKVSFISDPADQSEWSKYLCILVSGYIEESLRILLETYCANHTSSPCIKQFISKEIKGMTNCHTQKIISILSKFNVDWGKNFTIEIEAESSQGEKIKICIDSIVNNRNLIAHGKSTGITYSKVLDHYKSVKKAVEVLEKIIR